MSVVLVLYRLFLTSSLSCLDMNNNPIPWFSLIKIPTSISPTKGLEFMYLDPNTQDVNIQSSLINDPGAVSYTLSQVNNKSVSSFIFNDQPPSAIGLNPQATTRAHAKGIVMYTLTEAVYVVHSIPLYPSFTSSGQINTTIDYNETIYGQNMMCVSLDPQTLFNLLGVMALIQPIVYYQNIIIQNNNVTKVITDVLPDLPPSFGIDFSQNNFQFYYIAKSGYSNLYLWDNSVSDYFHSGLNVESWGRPYMPGSCPPTIPYPVLNIVNLKVLNYLWKDTSDHSKWGVIDSSPVVCYGDMNRMTSQLTRGGGTLCINLDWYYKVHQSIIVAVNPCNT